MILIKILSEFIFLLYFAISIKCSNFQFSYEKCIKYIKNLNITCSKFNKDNTGSLVCEKWKPNNITAIFEIPIECQNKEYNLDILINNSNSIEIINCKIFMHKEILFNFQTQEAQKKFKEKVEILKCMKYLLNYFHKCIVGKNKSSKLNQCKEWKKKEINNNFNICFNQLEFFEKILYPKNDKLKFRNLLNDAFNISNIEFNYDEEKIEEKRDNFFFANKIDNENDNKNNLNESNKDCIEYGLNPLNEDLIICTKYE